jgi:SNF family Na+-dependent transporter
LVGRYCFHLQGRRISQARVSLAVYFLLVAFYAYSSTLKMEELCSSEMSVSQIIQRRIQKLLLFIVLFVACSTQFSNHLW